MHERRDPSGFARQRLAIGTVTMLAAIGSRPLKPEWSAPGRNTPKQKRLPSRQAFTRESGRLVPYRQDEPQQPLRLSAGAC